MPNKVLPRIVAVSADKKPLTLRIHWDKADESSVDVSGLVETFRVYEPLRSPEMFARVRVGEHGTDVVWSDEIDMAADTLWRLAQEQTGAALSQEAFDPALPFDPLIPGETTIAAMKDARAGRLETATLDQLQSVLDADD